MPPRTAEEQIHQLKDFLREFCLDDDYITRRRKALKQRMGTSTKDQRVPRFSFMTRFSETTNIREHEVEEEENATFLLQFFANFGDQLPVDSELKEALSWASDKLGLNPHLHSQCLHVAWGESESQLQRSFLSYCMERFQRNSSARSGRPRMADIKAVIRAKLQEASLLTAGGKKLASRGRSASARLLHEGTKEDQELTPTEMEESEDEDEPADQEQEESEEEKENNQVAESQDEKEEEHDLQAHEPMRITHPDQVDTLPMLDVLDSDGGFWKLDSKEDSQVIVYQPGPGIDQPTSHHGGEDAVDLVSGDEAGEEGRGTFQDRKPLMEREPNHDEKIKAAAKSLIDEEEQAHDKTKILEAQKLMRKAAREEEEEGEDPDKFYKENDSDASESGRGRKGRGRGKGKGRGRGRGKGKGKGRKKAQSPKSDEDSGQDKGERSAEDVPKESKRIRRLKPVSGPTGRNLERSFDAVAEPSENIPEIEEPKEVKEKDDQKKRKGRKEAEKSERNEGETKRRKGSEASEECKNKEDKAEGSRKRKTDGDGKEKEVKKVGKERKTKAGKEPKTKDGKTKGPKQAKERKAEGLEEKKDQGSEADKDACQEIDDSDDEACSTSNNAPANSPAAKKKGPKKPPASPATLKRKLDKKVDDARALLRRVLRADPEFSTLVDQVAPIVKSYTFKPEGLDIKKPWVKHGAMSPISPVIRYQSFYIPGVPDARASEANKVLEMDFKVNKQHGVSVGWAKHGGITAAWQLAKTIAGWQEPIVVSE